MSVTAQSRWAAANQREQSRLLFVEGDTNR